MQSELPVIAGSGSTVIFVLSTFPILAKASGTRALIAACQGGYRTGEKTLARQLTGRLGPGMLCLANSNFACYDLWRDAAAAGAQLLWRAGAQLGLPVLEVLPDGTYLSRLRAPRTLRKQGAAGIMVRVIEYHLQDASGQVTETFTLITTLLDPEAAPTRELAELYHARWQIEMVFTQLANRPVIRVAGDGWWP
jgi:hypothetical protein